MSFAHWQTPAVRDLAWVLQSPSLLNPSDQGCQYPDEFKAVLLPDKDRVPDKYRAKTPHSLVIDDAWCKAQVNRHKDWLLQLDNHPNPFVNWLQERDDPRLGYYFEALVEYWLAHIFAHDRLIPHLQVKNEQRTLGEFDFLREDNAGWVVHHWEVAVKFYLRYLGRDNSETWYGPNPRDRLDKKLHRLFHHQIRLSLHPQAARTMRDLKLDYPVLPHVLLKGYLFYPSHEDWNRQASQLQAIAPQHLRGWWSYIEPFEIPRASLDSRWLYLPRLNWLASAIVAPGMENKLMNYKQLHGFCLRRIKANKRPPLVAEMQCTDQGFWQELSRGFIVPPNWPYLGRGEKVTQVKNSEYI